MKNRWKFLSLLLALLFIIGSLASCVEAGRSDKENDPDKDGTSGGENPSDQTPPVSTEPVTLVANGATNYVIVHNSTDVGGHNAAKQLQSALESYTGVIFPIIDDRTERKAGTPEILVGCTNRGVDYSLQRTLRSGEWVIAREGETIYLLGVGEGLLKKACKYFADAVLDYEYCVTPHGEIHRVSSRYNVETVTLNGRPLTDYTVWVNKKDDIGFDDIVTWVDERLSLISGYMLTVKEYADGQSEFDDRAIVLDVDQTLGDANYKIDVDGDLIMIAVGSKATALALFANVIEDKLPATAKGSIALTVSSQAGLVSDDRLVPLSEGADIRVMTYNVLGNVEDAMPYVSATVGAYLPDFVCMQEYYGEANKQVTTYLAELGYGKICGKFTCASPTAVEREDLQYTNVGKYCNTPIFYRTDLWEEVESEAYLFYWQHRWPYTDTKSMAYGVFRSKSDGQLALVIGTHYALMADGYTEYKDLGYTDAKEGAEWRYQDSLEILKAVDALREKYPGILTIVGGDLNGPRTEKGIQALENHAVLSDAYVMADYSSRTSGGSFHDTHGKAPGANRQAIDHIFVSEDVADVALHAILKEQYVLEGSDHCPVIADILRK